MIQSLVSGLDGYLLKDADPEDVLAAIHSVASGSLVVRRSVSAVVVAAAASAPRADALAALDARDLETLELMVDGLGRTATETSPSRPGSCCSTSASTWSAKRAILA